MNAAVIFDVDGVLLELTRPEEELFFDALAEFVPADQLSRDWNSYRIRNDDDIITEILERYNKPAELKPIIVEKYLTDLNYALASGRIASPSIKGAGALLQFLSPHVQLGIATANLLGAAKLRLGAAGFWNYVQKHPMGAEGGGHKFEILARLLKNLNVLPLRVVYIGDNVNDVIAGSKNNVHFIGFSTDPKRLQQLTDHGATRLSSDHPATLDSVRQILRI